MKLLLIHSHQSVRQKLKTVLSNEYFSIDAAADVRKGLVSVCVNQYDVVIVEHCLPQIDAEWFCSELRTRKQTVPILVLTDEDSRAGMSCLNNGADDFLCDPLAMDELIARVRCLMRRPRGMHVNVVTVGPLRLDRSRRVITCNDRDVPLTRQEYLILEFLMLRRGAVVTKSEIIENTWDDPDERFVEGAFDTHLYRIRKKIGRRGQRLIHTYVGRGYRLG